MGLVESGDATSLDEVLVNTDETDQVTGWDIINGFDVATHHKNGTLDLLVVKILLLAGDEVGTHNADLIRVIEPNYNGKAYLLASGDFTREDTTESVEATLVGGGDHLGDVGHEWTVGITVLEGEGDSIVLGTFVELLHTVVLGGQWRWQVDGNHLEKGLTSWEPVAHEALEEWFALNWWYIFDF